MVNLYTYIHHNLTLYYIIDVLKFIIFYSIRKIIEKNLTKNHVTPLKRLYTYLTDILLNFIVELS